MAARHDNKTEHSGDRLARIRRERGFTQTEIGEKLNISQAMVSAYERGEVRLHAEIIASFAKALGVTADDIIGLSAVEHEPRASRKLLRRVEQIEKLPKRKQDVLVHTIDTFLKGAAT